MRTERINRRGMELVRVDRRMAKKLLFAGRQVYGAMVNSNVASPWVQLFDFTKSYERHLKENEELFPREFNPNYNHENMAFAKMENAFLYYNMNNGRGTYIKWYTEAVE